MSVDFFSHPVLNNPYERPELHWELKDGQPTGTVLEKRRPADFVTPIPKSKKQKQSAKQGVLDMEADSRDEDGQQYDPRSIINEIRGEVERWRLLKRPEDWQVTPETARLLHHWRHHSYNAIRPFFCQVEAVETAIWLTEVAPRSKNGKRYLDYIEAGNRSANPEIFRIALKLATGTGKTTVMAMLIAWQTVNAVRRPQSSRFTRGFLIVTPGITIKDRLRVLLPTDPENYYKTRELVPADLVPEVQKAKVVITNYHAFKLRETLDVSRASRALLQGRGAPIRTTETEGKMIQRVMPALMGMKNIMVLNDEAHHCYRETSGRADGGGDHGGRARRGEAQQRGRASLDYRYRDGEAQARGHHGLRPLRDSVLPARIRLPGRHALPVDDVRLLAHGCDRVRNREAARVPVSRQHPGRRNAEVPQPLGAHRQEDAEEGPLEGRDPVRSPQPACRAADGARRALRPLREGLPAMAGGRHPVSTGIHRRVPTTPRSSKLIYDYISGFRRQTEDGTGALSRRDASSCSGITTTSGNPLPRPQDAPDRQRAARIRRGARQRFPRAWPPKRSSGSAARSSNAPATRRRRTTVTDQELLREVMNTVGKPGQLGEQIRCVVSVSMLTEGWDANTVTHVLGVRAFGTQLLCEQVIGRALRRQSYDLNEEGLFNVEYADILRHSVRLHRQAGGRRPPQPPARRSTCAR